MCVAFLPAAYSSSTMYSGEVKFRSDDVEDRTSKRQRRPLHPNSHVNCTWTVPLSLNPSGGTKHSFRRIGVPFSKVVRCREKDHRFRSHSLSWFAFAPLGPLGVRDNNAWWTAFLSLPFCLSRDTRNNACSDPQLGWVYCTSHRGFYIPKSPFDAWRLLVSSPLNSCS